MIRKYLPKILVATLAIFLVGAAVGSVMNTVDAVRGQFDSVSDDAVLLHFPTGAMSAEAFRDEVHFGIKVMGAATYGCDTAGIDRFDGTPADDARIAAQIVHEECSQAAP